MILESKEMLRKNTGQHVQEVPGSQPEGAPSGRGWRCMNKT